jgi:hypothetical protein
MPRVQYLACTHCGSEYLVQRRGQSIGLEPFAAEQFELSKKIAAVEQSQGEGCSNVFFWIFLVAGVLFCGAGYLGRTFLHNNFLFAVGWGISMMVLVLAAGVVMRTLNTQRIERLKLEKMQRKLYEQQAQEAEQAEGEAPEPEKATHEAETTA